MYARSGSGEGRRAATSTLTFRLQINAQRRFIVVVCAPPAYLDEYADDAAHDAAVQRDCRARGEVGVELRLFFFHLLFVLFLRFRTQIAQTFKQVLHEQSFPN